MGWHNKVVWSEGLFLRPQLFQQQERYMEWFAHQRSAALSPFFWGFSRLAIDTDLLALGKLALKRAVGVFQDGTPFDAPGHSPLPEAVSIGPEHAEQVFYLALPVRLPQGEEISFENPPGPGARNVVFEEELADSNSMGMGPQRVQLARTHARIIPEKELTGAHMCLALAKIQEIRADGGIALDGSFIPTVAAHRASERLTRLLTEIHGLVHMRAASLAEELLGADSLGAGGEVSDFLVLQTLNRYEPLLGHYAQTGHMSAEALYTLFLSLAGELSTFIRSRTRRPLEYPPYRHDLPGACMQALADDLRALLKVVIGRRAERIAMEKQAFGIRVAELGAGEEFSSLILCASANMPREALQRQIMDKTKAAHPDQIRRLVGSHLPGIYLRPLPVPPRQVPFLSDTAYFELDQSGPLWKPVQSNGSLALHITGEPADLRLELWGIR